MKPVLGKSVGIICSKLSRAITALKVSADYSDKDDKSDRHDVVGATRESYDRTKTKLEASVTHRLNSDIEIERGL
ncbi:MtrB/PioB family outer membrane beta-barrel protein [Vibrio sp. M60_M31a]